MYFTDRRDYTIPFFLDANVVPITFLYHETILTLVHDVNNVWENVECSFIQYATSSYGGFYVNSFRLEIQKHSYHASYQMCLRKSSKWPFVFIQPFDFICVYGIVFALVRIFDAIFVCVIFFVLGPIFSFIFFFVFLVEVLGVVFFTIELLLLSVYFNGRRFCFNKKACSS